MIHKSKKVQENLINHFKIFTIPQFDASRFVQNESIKIAIAISGGGYRSMLTGAGILKGLDSTSATTLAGFLQSTSYIAGISGGSWLVMSNAIHDFETLEDLKNTAFEEILNRLLVGVPDFDPGYRPKKEFNERGIFSSILKLIKKKSDKYPISTRFEEVFQFYRAIHLEVQSKKSTGSFISFTDYWGRALTKRLFKNTRTFTSVMELPSFKYFNQPFPIITAVQKLPTVKNVLKFSKNSHLVEFTPFEFGSWDSYIDGFVELKYLGSYIENGETKGDCKTGYDDIGFIVATSSSVFNTVFLHVYNYMLNIKNDTKFALHTILKTFGLNPQFNDTALPRTHPDYAIYSPNPFYKYEGAVSIYKDHHLYLADGGDDGQNIPFQPFLQKHRPIDIILCYDMSGDIYNFPNGTSLRHSSQRYHNNENSEFNLPTFNLDSQLRSVFPHVPKPHFPLTQPLFLGCDLSHDYPFLTVKHNSTHQHHDYYPPLIVYTPNTNLTYPSNTSTFKLSYNRQEIKGMIENGINLATNGNSSYFAACLRCASLKRSFDRIRDFKIPKTCQDCFTHYCYHHPDYYN